MPNVIPSENFPGDSIKNLSGVPLEYTPWMLSGNEIISESFFYGFITKVFKNIFYGFDIRNCSREPRPVVQWSHVISLTDVHGFDPNYSTYNFSPAVGKNSKAQNCL